MEISTVIDAIAEKGFCSVPQWLSMDEVRQIRENFDAALNAGQFRQAGIGREQDKQIQTNVRGDVICWIDEQMPPFDLLFFPKIAELIQSINRGLYLGINASEFHLALYAPETFYKKHRDAFRDTDARKISMVLYLNTHWQPGDGGELVIYHNDTQTLVEPTAGTLVIFESALEHEVLLSHKPRYSLTGWLKRIDSVF